MTDPQRTTKYLSGTFHVVFHGDYVPVDETMNRLSAALDAGLEDLDDLRSWNFRLTNMTEVIGDPEGYDS